MGIKRPLGRIARVHGWRLATFLCAATLLLAILGAASASAAQNICVGVDSTNVCPDNWPNPDELSTAAEMASESELTNIYINPGTYSSPSGVDFGNKEINLIGVGAVRPTVTISSAAPELSSVITTRYANRIENLVVALPTSSGLTGIRAAIDTPDISKVSVEAPNAESSIGIHVSESSPKVVDTTINLGAGGSTGVFVDGSTSATIDDLTVTHASKAIELDGAQNFKVRRLVSHSKSGVVAVSSSGTVSSSVIMPSTIWSENSGGKGVSATSTTGEVNHVHVDNCTLIGGGAGSIGAAATATAAAAVQSINVNSSVLFGYETTAGTASISGGTATVGLSYSRFTGGVHGATTVASSSQQTNADFGFVNAAAGNYALTLDSPLVDAGDPAGLSADDSATDASDKPRLVSRGAGLIRDIGAYEAQNTAPVPIIQIVTAVPSTTSNTLFSAAGSFDADGDAMTYDWKFDGAPGVGGLTTQKMFILEGPHSVQLTVTDKTGAASQATAQFNVARGFLPLTIRSQNATLSRKGTFKIRLSCPAAAISNCSGRLLFQTAKKVNAKKYTKRPTWAAAKKKSKPAYLRAARYVFTVAPGTTKKIEVRTYSTFQNVLGVHKKFRIQSSLVLGTTRNANLTAKRATVTIRAPKSKKKKK